MQTLKPVEVEEHAFGIEGKAYQKVFEEEMYAPITLSELELYLQQNNNEAWALIEQSRIDARHRLEDAQRAEQEAEAARLAAVIVGPRLELSSQHLSLEHCAPGRTTQAHCTVSNVGTTALFYRWSREERDLPPGALRGGERWFYLHDQEGSVLPGQTKEFRFSFCASTPGVFHDRWRLTTSPQLSAAHAPSALTLTAVCLCEDDTAADRAKLDAELDARSQKRKVARVVRTLSLTLTETRTRPTFGMLTAENVGIGTWNWNEGHHAARSRRPCLNAQR